MSDEPPAEDPEQAEARRQSVEAVRECVERTTDVMREAMDASAENGLSIDEILLSLRSQFIERGARRYDEDDLRGIHADYSNYCGVLVCLVEAQDRIDALEGMIEMHTLLLKVIDADAISMEVRKKGEDEDG